MEKGKKSILIPPKSYSIRPSLNRKTKSTRAICVKVLIASAMKEKKMGGIWVERLVTSLRTSLISC